MSAEIAYNKNEAITLDFETAGIKKMQKLITLRQK